MKLQHKYVGFCKLNKETFSMNLRCCGYFFVLNKNLMG